MWYQSQRSFLTWSASSTSQILQPVAGLKVGNVLLLLDGTHLLSMKIYGKMFSKGLLQKKMWTFRAFPWPPPAAGELSGIYLGVSDVRDLDRLRKRQSWGHFTPSVLFCSILFHFGEAGRPGSVSSLCVLCLLLLWSFITMWSQPLLAQELQSLTPPR